MGFISCAVIDCKNRAKRNVNKEKELKFHGFPQKDKQLCKVWVTKCKRQDLNVQYARICSDHFTPEDYERDLPHELLGLPIRKFLKKDAVPSVFEERGIIASVKRPWTLKRITTRARKEIVSNLLANAALNKHEEEVEVSIATDGCAIDDTHNQNVPIIPEPEKLNCMVCLSVFTEEEYKNFSHNAEPVEILSDIFKVLCKYMKWNPPSKFQYYFNTDIFPFCKDCQLLVTKLYKHERLLLHMKNQIVALATQLSAKILESQNDLGDLSSTEGLKSSETTSYKFLKDVLSTSEKLGYYRDSTCSRYTPYVRLVSDSTLKRTGEGREATSQINPASQVDLWYIDSINSPSSYIFEVKVEDPEDNISNFDDGEQEKKYAVVTEDDFIHNVSKNSQTSCISQDKDEGANDSKDDGGQENEVHFWDLVTETFPKYGDRLKRVGDCLFLLDDKSLFEYSNIRLKCISCDILFGSKESLRKHLCDCPGNPLDDVIASYKYNSCVYDQVTNGELRCRRCSYLCKSRNTMLLHMTKFHGTKSTYKAKIKPVYIEVEPNKYLCNQKYPFEFKDEKFSCGTCFSEFSDRSDVLTHIEIKHIWVELKKKIQYKEISPGKFAWTDPFNKSFSFQKVGSVYNCGDCSLSSSNLRLVKDHIRFIHIEQSSAVCEICGKVFQSNTAMKLHMKMHNDERPFICEVCGKSYRFLKNLVAHRAQKHMDMCDKKYECEVCRRVFGAKTLLSDHEKSHKNIICDVCGKTVKLTSQRIHMLAHKRESKFECKKCCKKLKSYSSLYMHTKRHNGPKSYSCDICNMKFTFRYSVKVHKNNVHSSNNVKISLAKSGTRKRQTDVSYNKEKKSYENK